MTTGMLRKIEQIVRDLRPYQPEKVILFGSYAWGKPTEDSDIDLFIIKNTSKPRHRRTDDVYDLIYKKDYFTNEKFPGPVDVVVYTPREVRERLKLGDFFINEIFEKGKVLMERL